jgi:hypothetical protein
MRCLLAIWLGLLATVAIAEEPDREVALPFVTLIQPPHVPKLERMPLSEERVEEIEGLMFELTKCVKSDLSLNSHPIPPFPWENLNFGD